MLFQKFEIGLGRKLAESKQQQLANLKRVWMRKIQFPLDNQIWGRFFVLVKWLWWLSTIVNTWKDKERADNSDSIHWLLPSSCHWREREEQPVWSIGEHTPILATHIGTPILAHTHIGHSNLNWLFSIRRLLALIVSPASLLHWILDWADLQ